MPDAPILFLIFNRPEKTRAVFEAIAKARPGRLFVAADGPRPEVPEDAERCRQARDVISRVDWDCQIVTLFRDENLGCGKAVSSAIDWFFEQVEEGIILEDDCLPSESFFPYCGELLERYRDDSSVMSISGSKLVDAAVPDGASYYFSIIPQIWGWASWRRAWRHYDVSMKGLPGFLRSGGSMTLSGDPDVRAYWLRHFIGTCEGRIDTWDYQWLYAIMARGGLTVRPGVNLVKNIGHDSEATHTFTDDAGMVRPAADLPEIKHPPRVLVHEELDMMEHMLVYDVKCTRRRGLLTSWRKRLRRRWKIRRTIRRFLNGHGPAVAE